MPSVRVLSAFAALIVICLAAPGAALARVSAGTAPAAALSPLHPLDGERVFESTARFELSPDPDARDVRVVIARIPFETTGWTSRPSGPPWTILEGGSDMRGLAGRTDTPLWYAVTWTDARTGAFRASPVRSFTLVPRFANRIAPDAAVRPTATGRLPRVAAHAPRRPIELSSGYSLVAGNPLPEARVAAPETDAPESPGAKRAYVVQFGDDSADAARARVTKAGGSIAAAIGDAGWLVRMSAEQKTRLAEGDGEPWIADFVPAYKLSPELPPSGSGTVEVTALFFPDADAVKATDALRGLGARAVKTARSVARFTLDRARLADAAALADVEWLEPAPRDTTSNDLAQWVVQSGVPNERPVWDHGIRGQGQVVMVADSGIRANHEMFNDSTQVLDHFGDFPTHRKIVAYKPGSNDPTIEFGDDAGHSYHGTHTDGTVAGDPSPYSNAPWSGMAKDAKLYFMDMGGSANGGLYPPVDLNDLFQPSYDGNAGGAARISSNSWGSTQSVTRYTVEAMMLDQFVWNHPDYLVAFAAGNYGVLASVQSPGTAKNCLTVGATGNGADQNKLASFSSRGPAADGRRKPTVMGPGDGVTSSIGNTRWTYAAYSGTSMATPAVAGAMALVRQYLTEGSYPTGVPVASNTFVPSAALMRAIAVNAARNDIVGQTAPSNVIGYGRLTIDDVLYFPGDARRTVLIDPKDGLEDQQYVEYQVQVSDASQPLKIALCWSDAPGTPLAQVALVNDLDLVVTNGVVSYRGNALLNFASAVNGPRDSLNVEELVNLPNPSVGTWTVRVEGHHVMQGPQPFALCITGGVGGSNGAIALDRFQYGLNDTLGIEVVDANAASPLTVQVRSDTEPYDQRVVLTGGNGVFRGAIRLAPAAIRLNDGVLAASTGDLVTATYVDASTGVPVVAQARVNLDAPAITNVHATGLTGNRTLVTWTTDVAGSSRVWYGTSALATIADSSGSTTQHRVLLENLVPGTLYRYDVESVTRGGDVARDSLGGAHRTFTQKPSGNIALLMDDPSTQALATWTNAFAALGWNADVLPAALNDPPLVGNTSKGLRSYEAVLWQVDPDKYPPFSDAQRAAIDSLLDGGGRLLVTGHDIGFGLVDAGSPGYTPAREAWVENTLKSRYFTDNLYADSLIGVPASPVSGAGVVKIDFAHYPDSGDNIVPPPGVDGTWMGDWTDDFIASGYMGMHWESATPKGTNGVGVWGGKNSRLVGMFYEWASLAGSSSAHLPARTGVLERSVAYLLGHRPPEVHLTSPAPGTVVTNGFLPITYSAQADAGRTIASRAFDYSLDGGETWQPIVSIALADSGGIWDLGAALGGTPTPNSTRVLVRVRVTDDGSPALHGSSAMTGTFTLARPGGDVRGPVVVAGTASCSPTPLRGGDPATLFATLSDAETGGGAVSAAEYSFGASPAAAGAGTAMTGTFGTATVQASAALSTNAVVTGTTTVWVRGRDAANNWGSAFALSVPSVSKGVVAADAPAFVDFLAAPTPNPFHGAATLHFGLAHAGNARLELFDLAGRRVRTLASGELAAGPHAVSWDGRDDRGAVVGAGVYFVRFTAPSRSFTERIVALR